MAAYPIKNPVIVAHFFLKIPRQWFHLGMLPSADNGIAKEKPFVYHVARAVTYRLVDGLALRMRCCTRLANGSFC